MTDLRTGRAPHGLPAEITHAFVSLWTRYSGERPTDAHTEVRGNVVTCVLVDAVSAFDERIGASPVDDSVAEAEKPTSAAYKQEAVAAIVRLTRQRVASFVSSHDAATDVATEVFTLEPSLNRGNPYPSGRESSIRPGSLSRAREAGRGRR